MKASLIVVACLAWLCGVAQEKWFVSICPSTAGCWGGPAWSIKHQMTVQGFDEESTYLFLGSGGSTDHPFSVQSEGTFWIRFGKRINSRRGIFFILSKTDQRDVEGFKYTSYSSFLGIIGGATGPKPRVSYSVFQVSGGCLFYPSGRIKMGAAPSLFIVPYSSNSGERQQALMPGVTGTMRVPLGREKHRFGLDWFVDVNLAPPIKMNIAKQTAEGFELHKANMILLSTGIAFTFRG